MRTAWDRYVARRHRDLAEAFEDGKIDIDPEDFEEWADEQLKEEKSDAFDAY